MRFFIFPILYLFAGFVTSAQIRDYKLNNLSGDDGLPTDNILFTFQDSFGFLWMGSYEGLIRWDGYHYKRYVYSSDDTTSLSGNIVYTILEDHRKRLWIGTIDGLNLYDREKDNFTRCDIGKETYKIPINDIEEDSQNRLWLGTSYGLCRYDHDGAVAQWYVHDPLNANSLSNDVVFRLSLDGQDNLWIATFEGGVNRYAPADNSFTRYLHRRGDASSVCSNKIKSILVDQQDRIWIGSLDKGVTVMNKHGEVIRHFANTGTSNGRQALSDVSCIYEDRNQTIWLGVKGQVLRYKEKDSDRFLPFSNTPYSNPALYCVSISGINEDRFGNLWFSSQSHGLFVTNRHKNIFRHEYKGKQEGNELNHNVVTSVLEDHRGNIWMGTDGGGLTLFEQEKNKYTTFTVDDGLSSNSIQEIRQDSDGKLWLASWSGGIMRFDPMTKQVSAFVNNPASDNSLILNNVKSVLPNDSLILIGTHGEGLSVYDRKRGKFINQANNSLFPFNLKTPAWINHLFADSKGRLWISTYGGLFLYEGQDLKHFTPTDSNNSISSDVVNMVSEDREGRIWVVSESGGLDQYREMPGDFVRYNEIHDLPKAIKSITFDLKGKMWLGSNEGIIAFEMATGEIERFDQTDGLQGSSFFHKAALTARDGTLYFGGPKGVNFFHPDSLEARRKTFSFPVYLTDLHIYDQLQTRDNPGSPLEKVLSFTDTLVLHPEQSFFSIGYAALNLYAPSKTRYAYKLEGLHDQWINNGYDTRASFTELDPGDYVFRVRYTDLSGAWHDSEEVLHIRILPPWWKTWWFRLLVVIAVIASVLGIFYMRLSSIRKQNRLLEAEVAKRTRELSEANHYLIEKNEEIKSQNEKLEEYNSEVLRQSEKILLQQEQNVAQNHILEKTVHELHKSNQTKDRFFSILAHDLRNPVSALSGVAETLKLNLSQLSRKDISEYVQSIYRSSQSVYHLLINLLNWSRTQSQNIQYSPAEFDIGALILKNIALLETECGKKNIRVDFRSTTTHKAWADYNMIDTVVRNLLGNSIKFTPPGGEVVVTCRQTEDQIAIDVKDNGIGMGAEQLGKIFNIEKKFLSVGTAGETGTGLGLVIAREFVEVNKGAILVSSEPGKGSVFSCMLPKSDSLIDGTSESQPLPSESGHKSLIDFPEEKILKIKGKRILIIDDDKELRRFLKINLSAYFEIFEAENGSDGLRSAIENQPAVVITDVMMPLMDGEEFCRQLKTLPATSHIPVVLLTSQTYEEGQLVGYGAGADIYLTKPARKELLFQVIYNLMQAREKIHARLLNSNTCYPDDVALNKVDESFLNQVIGIVEANLSDPEFDSRLICEQTALSRTVLYAKVKALTGQGVHEFIRSIRLKKSLTLLREQRLNVSQVAYEVGFSSHSYFNKCFVRQFNVTPKDYVKNLKKETVED